MGNTRKGVVEDMVGWDFSVRTPAATPSPSGLSSLAPPACYPKSFRDSCCSFFGSPQSSSFTVSATDVPNAVHPEAQFGGAWATAIGDVVSSSSVDDLVTALWAVAKLANLMSAPELEQAGLDFSTAVHETRVSRPRIFVSSGE